MDRGVTVLDWLEPGTVREWATLVGIGGGAVLTTVTVWRQVVGPFVARVRAGMREAWDGFAWLVAYARRELTNGADPAEYQGVPTRRILIDHVTETRPLIDEHHRLTREFAEHQASPHAGHPPP